ncbi:MAG: hypothetical protein WBP29_11920 [Candidatus Zixiibacteriota bacterium]
MENDIIGKCAEDNLALSCFLRHPEDRQAFTAFFRMCHKLTVGSLKYLQRRGYRLPVGPHNSFAGISDLAIDVLGTFLRCEKGVRFGVVFNYFTKQGNIDLQTADGAMLMSRFRALLLGYVRQELFRITQQEYPEAADLKRRLNQILANDKYSAVSADGHSAMMCLTTSLESVRSNRPTILLEILERLAEEAYLTTRSIEEWCAKIFSLLIQRDEYAPVISKHHLLAVAVKISATHLEVDSIAPSALPTPAQLALSSELEKLRAEVSEFIRTEVITRFVRQGRIAKESSACYERAVEMFLADKSNGNGVDLLPKYFRETMPEAEHEHYLKRHKYVFETVMNRAEMEFVERIKKSSTIRRL